MRIADIFGRSFAFYPWIFLTSRVANSKDVMLIAIKKCHEDVHLKRQKSFWGACKYNWKYCWNKEFRKKEETRAWIEELKVTKALKFDIDKDKFIATLLNEYNCFTREDAENILKNVLNS